MAICRNCGAEGARVRVVFSDTEYLRDECPACAPQSFEKQTDPSDKKIWIGPEVRPKDYEKREDSLGVYYEPTEEATAELEKNIFVNHDEKEAHDRAAAKKRAENRQGRLTPEQIAEAIKRADAMIRPMVENKDTAFIV